MKTYQKIILVVVAVVMSLGLAVFVTEMQKRDQSKLDTSAPGEALSDSAEDGADAGSGSSTQKKVTTTVATTADDGFRTAANQKRDLSQFKGKKLIAITFDDGPAGDTTKKILDNLDKYNARVTFFVVGNRVDEFKDNLKRAYDMGCQIGSHSYEHKNLAKISADTLKEDLKKTDEKIKSVTGEAPVCLRPPYGSLNDTVRQNAGKPLITWDIDTLDWKYKNTQTVRNNILNHAYDGAVVLLHDLYETSVDGALSAMDTLYQQGYAFVTIDEMARLRNVKMEDGKSYYSFKPGADQTTTTTTTTTTTQTSAVQTTTEENSLTNQD